jgi:CubicO group peptidase (beta-lactamase class C family)
MMLLSLIMMGACSSDGGNGDGGLDPRFDEFVEALQADLDSSLAYGVSAAVMEDGRVTFARALGVKDAAGEEPLTPETLMQIGSTTKQMTAVALLRNVEAGQVALDDTLEEVLPELEFALDGTWDDQVTLHDLLSHQGAFYDYIPWDGPADDTELVDWTYGVFDESYFLMNTPGVFWNYSNPNFVFAGLISEEQDSRFWPDIMVEDLFAPLGMDRTFLRRAEVEEEGDYSISYGLGLDDLTTGAMGPVDMTTMPDPGWGRPAGLVWTTPTQMMAWADFVMHGNTEVLSDDLRAEMTSEQVDTLMMAGNQYYGYGMFVERGYLTGDGTYYETPVWQHDGNTLSFSHQLYILPEHNFAVSVCASGYGADFMDSVDVAVTSLVDLPEESEPPTYTFDPAALDNHLGTYNDPYNVGETIIRRVGDALRIEMPDLEAYGYDVDPDLITISSNLFLLDLDGDLYELTFVPETQGGTSVYIRNRLFVSTRVDTTEDAGEPSAAAVQRVMERARTTPMPASYQRALMQRLQNR